MSRYFIVQDGKRLYADAKDTIERAAQLVADKTGRDVPVFGGAKPKPKTRLTARRNPTGLQALSKLRDVSYQVTGVSPWPRRARLVAYATTKAEAGELKRHLEGMGYTHLVVKPEGWQKNSRKRPAKRKPAKARARRRVLR
jgi:hypothetical protein